MRPGPGPAPPGLEDWAEVTGPQWHGDIGVGVNWARVTPVAIDETPAAEGKKDRTAGDGKEAPAPENYLVLRLTIANRGEAPFTYLHPGKGEVKLKDERGNPFPVVNEDRPKPLKGQVRSATVPPKQGVEDLLLFSPANLHKGQHLLLELPAKRFGGSGGSIKIRIPGGFVRD
jgi:hypothetical protein